MIWSSTLTFNVTGLRFYLFLLQVTDAGDSQSFKEPSEEVRLILARINSKLIEKSILSDRNKEVEHLKLHFEQILSIIRSILSDNFSDVKEVGCESVELFCRALPMSAHLNGPSMLFEPLVKIVSHQQKKIRMAAVKAIGEPLSPFWTYSRHRNVSSN